MIRIKVHVYTTPYLSRHKLLLAVSRRDAFIYESVIRSLPRSLPDLSVSRDFDEHGQARDDEDDDSGYCWYLSFR